MFRNENNLAIFATNSCFNTQEKRPFFLLKEFTDVYLSPGSKQL